MYSLCGHQYLIRWTEQFPTPSDKNAVRQEVLVGRRRKLLLSGDPDPLDYGVD